MSTVTKSYYHLGSILPNSGERFQRDEFAKIVQQHSKLKPIDSWWTVNPGTGEIIPLGGKNTIARIVARKKTAGVFVQSPNCESIDVSGAQPSRVLPLCEKIAEQLDGTFAEWRHEFLIEDRIPETLMMIAICELDLAAAGKLIDQGIDVNSGYPTSGELSDDEDYGYSRPFLFTAASIGATPFCELLIRHGADPDRCFGPAVYRTPPLFEAARGGHSECCKSLMKHTHRRFHSAARHLLAQSKLTLEQSRLLSKGEEYAHHQKRGVTSIQAVLPELKKIGRLRDNLGQILGAACWSNNRAVVEWLLNEGANVEAVNDAGSTPLMSCSDPAIAKLLLNAGAKVNAKDMQLRTPLMTQKNPQVMKMLLDHGASVRLKDIHGNGAVLHTAFGMYRLKRESPSAFKKYKSADADYAKILSRLLADGATVNGVFPEDGITELMMLAKTDLQKSVDVLIKAGSDPAIADHSGKLAWEYASSRSPLRKILKEAAAKSS